MVHRRGQAPDRSAVSRIAKAGLFAQESDTTHDELVIAAHKHAGTLVRLITKPYIVSEEEFRWSGHLERHVQIERLTGVEVEVEKPVYGSREFLVGFADLLITAGSETRSVEREIYDSTSDGWSLSRREPDQVLRSGYAWRALVEAKSGPLKMGETMRQMKAYARPLRADALVLLTHPGNRPEAATLELLAGQGIVAVEWANGAFAALNFVPKEPDPEYIAPEPVPAPEPSPQPSAPEPAVVKPAPRFSWHAFLTSCPPHLKAFLLPVMAEVSEAGLSLHFDSRHAFHYRCAEQRHGEIESLAGVPTRLTFDPS